MTRPWPFNFAEKNFPKDGNNETYLLRGKWVQYVRTYTGGLRESHTLMVFWISFMGHFFQVSFGQSFCFACFWVCIWFISGFSHLCAHLSSSWTQWRGLWADLASLRDLLSDFSSQKDLLDLRMRNMWFLIWADPAYSLDFPAIDILEFLSTRNEPQLLSAWRRKGIYLPLPILPRKNIR